jgi:putative SOS response-associated peptidase YedK
MCGRYTLITPLRELTRRFQVETVLLLKPRYNLAPTQQAPVIVLREGKRELRFMRWGLIPPWAKEKKGGYAAINARAESLASRPMFRHALKWRRCLVLADGFYEWRDNHPYRFTLTGEAPMAFAGLWEGWHDPEGNDLDSFSIVTIPSRGSARILHDRMPLILTPAGEAKWLSGEPLDQEAVNAICATLAEEALEVHGVSKRVNSARYDAPDCLVPDEVA